MNLHNPLILTDAVIAALQAVGLTVGDAVAPTTIPANTGYVVVHSLPGGYLDGSLGTPDDDAEATYMLTSIGSSRKQCEWVANKVFQTIMSTNLSIGWTRRVMRVGVDTLGGATREEDVQPPKWYWPERYRIWTTPQ